MADTIALPTKKFIFPSFRFSSIGYYLAGALIILFAFIIRADTFWLPHWQGDQSQYLTLAMKLDAQGLKGYNLFEAEVHFLTLNERPEEKIVYVTRLPKGQRGDFAKAYERTGLNFYNELPFFYKAPLFPVTLMASHRIFAKVKQPYTTVFSNLGKRAGKVKSGFFLEAQTWAVIVPLFSSLLMILVTFLFGRKLFGPAAGLFAGFIMAVNPIDIITSQRLLADDLVSLLVVSSLFVFFVAHERRSYLGVCASGFLCGLAILAKQNAALLFVTVWVYLLLAERKKEWRLKDYSGFIFNHFFLCYFLSAVLISAQWFWEVYKVYGDPFYQPSAEKMVREDLSGWFGLLAQRQSLFFLFFVRLVYLCPPFLFGHGSLKYVWKEWKDFFSKKITASPLLFLWLWITPIFLFFVFRIESREERYLLPVFPALAMLSGYGLDRFRKWISPYFTQPVYATVIICLFLALTAVWSVPIALENVLQERFLILRPVKDWLSYYGILNA